MGGQAGGSIIASLVITIVITASTIFLVKVAQEIVAVLFLPTFLLEIPISEHLPVACHAFCLRIPLRFSLGCLI